MTNNDEGPLEEPLKDFVSSKFIEKFQDLPFVRDDKYSRCHVELHIDYIKQLLIIEFTEDAVFSSTIQDQYFEINIFVGKAIDDNIPTDHYIEYGCSDYECDKKFIIQHLDWFIAVNFTASQQKLDFLISIDDKQTRK